MCSIDKADLFKKNIGNGMFLKLVHPITKASNIPFVIKSIEVYGAVDSNPVKYILIYIAKDGDMDNLLQEEIKYKVDLHRLV